MMKQGSPSSNALFLSSGMAKIYIEGINGKNFIMSIAKPGRLIMGPGAYVNSRYTYTVSALTKVQVCFISFDVFRHLARVNADFAEGLLTDISAKSLKTHNRLINLTQKKMPGRMAETLLYLADEIFVDFDAGVLNTNRFYTGIIFKIFKQLKGDLYYLWQSKKEAGD